MDAGPTWHPGRSATLGLGKAVLAAFGELHPRIAKALDAPAGTVAAELYLDAIPAPRGKERARAAFAPPALQPLTPRFRLHRAGRSGRRCAGPRDPRGRQGADHRRARMFDRYEGAAGLSLAVEVTLQPTDKTLTEAEIGEMSAQDRRRGGEAGGEPAGVERVDRGVDPRLDLGALQPRRG